MAVNTTQGIVLAIFGANAGGHLSSLDANATANGNASLANDLSAAAGLILGVDLSSDATFTSTVLGNLGIAEGTDGYTLASNYFTTNLAAGAGRGDLVAAAVDYLLGSNVDASLADTATAFSTRVTDGVSYSQSEGASVFGVAALQTAAGSAASANGSTFELTTDDENITGTAGNDVITGAAGTLSAEDSINDGSTADADVLNLVLTADPSAEIDITNIETINIDWDGFGTPDVGLGNVSGANVVLSSDKSGYLGNANFTAVGSNSITTGAGVARTVTVDAADGSTVTSSNAATVTLTNAEGDNVVNADVATTISITGGDSAVVTAAAATDVTVAGGEAEVVTLNLGTDADVTLTVDAEAAVTINNTSAEGIAATLAANATLDTLTGTGTIDAVFESSADVTGATVSGFGDVSIDLIAATADLSAVSADTITFNAETDSDLATGVNLVFADGANVVLDAAINDTAEIADFLTDAEDDGSSDSINIRVQVADLEGQYNFAEGEEEFETVNITFAEGDAEDLAQVEGLTAAAGGAINLTSAEFDVTVESIDANEINASAVAGALTLSDVNNGDAEASGITVIGGSDDNTLDFNAELGTLEVTFTAASAGETAITLAGGEGYDQNGEGSLTIINTGTGGASLTLSAEDIIDNALTLISGDGDDTFTAEGASTLGGDAEVSLGGGDNTITLAGALGDVTLNVATGDGDDELTIGAEFGDDAEATVAIDLGAGTNTLVLAQAVAVADVTITGVDVIELGSSSEDSIGVDMLSSLDFTVTGDGFATYTDAEAVIGEAEDTFNVLTNMLDMTSEGGTVDLSGVTIDRTVDEALSGISLTVVTDDAEDTSTITLNIHGDTLILGESEGTDTFVQGGADSVALTAFLNAANGEDVAGAETFAEAFDAEADGLDAEDVGYIHFANGLDVITGFTAGEDGDQIDFTNTGAPVDVFDAEDMGSATIGNLTEDTIFALQGDWNATGNVFSITFDAEGAAAGEDVLVFENQDSSANDSFLTLTNAVVLTGVVTAELGGDNFV